MKKIVFLILVVSLTVFSCKSNYTKIGDKNANYIPYYLKVYEADSLFKAGNYTNTYNILDSIFQIYKPKQTLFINELNIYLELAYKLNKDNKRVDEIIDIMISNYGSNISKFDNGDWVQIKKMSNYTEQELKEKFLNYKKGLNHDLIESISEMANLDKKFRKEGVEKLIDSIDGVNGKKLIKIINKYGYPGHHLVGGLNQDDKYNPIMLSVLLKHLSDNDFLILEPIILNEVKLGNCSPYIYASMIDNKIKIDRAPFDYPYYGTIRNIIPENLKLTNKERLKIGLPIIN